MLPGRTGFTARGSGGRSVAAGGCLASVSGLVIAHFRFKASHSHIPTTWATSHLSSSRSSPDGGRVAGQAGQERGQISVATRAPLEGVEDRLSSVGTALVGHGGVLLVKKPRDENPLAIHHQPIDERVTRPRAHASGPGPPVGVLVDGDRIERPRWRRVPLDVDTRPVAQAPGFVVRFALIQARSLRPRTRSPRTRRRTCRTPPHGRQPPAR